MASDPGNLPALLIAHLRDELGSSGVEYKSPPARLPGGYDAQTFRFEVTGGPPEWSRPLVLRLYEPHLAAEVAIWESVLQNALAAEGLPVPGAHLVCGDASVLGGVFLVMELLPGKQLISAPTEVVFETLGRTHAELHRIDPASLIRILYEGHRSIQIRPDDAIFVVGRARQPALVDARRTALARGASSGRASSAVDLPSRLPRPQRALC